MTPSSNCPESYKQWISTYSCLERKKRVEIYIDLIDQIVAKSSYEEFKILQAVFYRMSELEYKFWDDAYHLRREL